MSPRPKGGQTSKPPNTRSRTNNKSSSSSSSTSMSSPEIEMSTCSSTPNENTGKKTARTPSFSKDTKNKTVSKASTKTATRSSSSNAARSKSPKNAQPVPGTSNSQASTSTSRACTKSPVLKKLTDSPLYNIVSKTCNNENTPPTTSFLRYILEEIHSLANLETSTKKVSLMHQILYDLAEYVSRKDNPMSESGALTEAEAECHTTNYNLNVTLMELRNIDSSIHELSSRKIDIYNRLDANLFCRPPPSCMPDMSYIPEEMDVHCPDCPEPGPPGMPALHLPHNLVTVSPQQQMTTVQPPVQMISPTNVRLPAPIPVPPPPPVPAPPPPPPPVPPLPPQNSNQYFDGQVVNVAAKSSCFVVPVKREINIIEGNPEDIAVSKITTIKTQHLITLKHTVVCSCKNGKLYTFLAKNIYFSNLPHKMNKFHICAGPVAAMLVWNSSLIIATVSGTIKKCSVGWTTGCQVVKTFEVGEEIVCMAEIQGVLYVSTKPSYLHIINLRSLTLLKDTVETGHLVKVLKSTFYNDEEILVCLNDEGEITGSAIHEGVIGSVVFKFTLPGVTIFDVYIKRQGPPRVTFFCGSKQNATCLHLENGVFSQGRMVKLASSAMVTYKHLNFLGTHHGDVMIFNITTMQTYVYSSIVKESIVSLLYVPKFLYIATEAGIYCVQLKNHDQFLKAAANK